MITEQNPIKLRKFSFIPNLPSVFNYAWLLISILLILQLTKKLSLILSLQNIMRNVPTHDPTQIWTMLLGKTERWYGFYSHLQHSCNSDAVYLYTWKTASFLFRRSHLFIFQLCSFSTFLCAQVSYHPVLVSIFVKEYTGNPIIWVKCWLCHLLAMWSQTSFVSSLSFGFSLLQNTDINAPASSTVPDTE